MLFAPVAEVRVYRNSAVVRRKAVVSLQAGTNEVVLSGISNSADPDSLRLFFSADIVGKDMQILPLSEAVGRLPSDELDKEIDALRSRIQTLQTVEQLWISNGNFATRGECSNDTIEGYLRALPAHIEELRKEQNDLEKQIEKLEEERSALLVRESFQAIRLVLEAPQACEAVCELEYAEKSARWVSTYEIHTAADDAEVRAVSRARITQSTGEDWENVHVSLYSGNPAARQEIPVLKNMKLQFHTEPELPHMVAAGAMPGMMMSVPMGMGMAMAANAPVQKMAMEESEEVDADTMTGFALPGTRTVKSGTVGTMVDLKTDTVPAEKRIVCIPKLDSTAYLAAVIRTADWPLKPAMAKIYLNENYCGETFIAPDMTEQEFLLSLGSDERISLSRETVTSFTEDVLLKGLKRNNNIYEIRITNNREKPLSVLVYDQIPVSTDKQIKVELGATGDAVPDTETGKLKWTLTVPGKTTVEKRFAYQVSYPKDKKVDTVMSDAKSGLKRRCAKCGNITSQLRFCENCGNPL